MKKPPKGERIQLYPHPFKCAKCGEENVYMSPHETVLIARTACKKCNEEVLIENSTAASN